MFFGAGAIIIAKFAMATTDGIVFSCIVSGFAALFCGIWAKIDGDLTPPKAEGKARWAFVAHVLASVIGAGSLWCAVELVDPAIVSIVSRVEIVISLALSGFILRERFRPVEWGGALVVIAGVVVMKLASTGTLALVFESTNGKGFLLALSAGAGYGSAEVFAKMGTHSATPPAFAFYRNLCMTFIFGAWLLVRGGFEIPEARVLGIIAAAAMGGPVIARVLWFEAIHLMPLSRAVILAQTHPLWTAFLSWLVLGTVLKTWEWGGAIVVLAGCVIVTLGGAASRRTPALVLPIPEKR